MFLSLISGSLSLALPLPTNAHWSQMKCFPNACMHTHSHVCTQLGTHARYKLHREDAFVNLNIAYDLNNMIVFM